ncbi:transposase [Streptomyces decoyicus]|uniref:transposase n=1 Tax=Streptomyces decoyicus TaxID=249567 RepID=UPI00365F1CEF
MFSGEGTRPHAGVRLGSCLGRRFWSYVKTGKSSRYSWCQDAEHRTRAGIPDRVEFATKPTLAGQMIAQALDAGISASWVTADEAYGQDPGLRALLESRRIDYVLAVACSTRVRIKRGQTAVRADTVADRLPASPWHPQSAGAGAKGPRYYDWAWIETGADAHRHLLIRRNPSSSDSPSTCAGPRSGCRCPSLCGWPGPVGAWGSAPRPRRARADSTYQVRHWTAWHQHVTLAMLALAFLATPTATPTTNAAKSAQPNRPARSTDQIDLTVPMTSGVTPNCSFEPPSRCGACPLLGSSDRRASRGASR